jgi:hypothetical protein
MYPRISGKTILNPVFEPTGGQFVEADFGDAGTEWTSFRYLGE